MSVLIDVDELAARLGAPGLVVLDATVELPAPEFDGDYRASSGLEGWAAGHVPGSRHADLLGALSDHDAPYHFAMPAPAVLVAGVGPGSDIVLYDRGGGLWSARLWWMLRSIGVPARVVDGGWAAWQAAGGPVATADAGAGAVGTGAADASVAGAAAVGVLVPEAYSNAWVSRAELEAWAAGRVPATVACALGADAYSGAAPTRYSRRGHIPGTSNVPARRLTGPDGRYLPLPELRAALGALADAPGPVWTYCGGGIAAAGLALALTLIGRDDVAIYDGSLEEWSADPSLPLEAPGEERPAAAPDLGGGS